MSDPDFEARWAEIVAELSTRAGAEEDGPARAVGPEAEPAAPPGRADPGPDGTALGLAALFEPLQRREPAADSSTSGAAADAFVDSWQDEGEFVPPTPPELPVGTPVKRMGWAGALGGLCTLVLIGLTGWPAPRIVTIAAGLAMLAGFVTLVWQLPESREDGWDDGAQL